MEKSMLHVMQSEVGNFYGYTFSKKIEVCQIFIYLVL